MVRGTTNLSYCDSDEFCPDVGEESVGKRVPGPQEGADLVLEDVRAEGTGVLPVAEADSVVRRSSSEIEDDTEDDETAEDDDLDGRHPELDFSEN
jgi:hypothetical protein